MSKTETTFIVKAITNLGTTPADRIHNLEVPAPSESVARAIAREYLKRQGFNRIEIRSILKMGEGR